MSFDSPIRSSWSPPPVDGSLTVPEIFDWHYEHNPDHISFVYPDGDGSPKQITMKEAVRAMHRAGRYYTQKFTDLGYPPDIHNAPVIAIYAATGVSMLLLVGRHCPVTFISDTVSYLCTWLGIARAGYTVFHISPRNSATALAHLLKNAGAVHVLTSSELALKQVVEVAVATLNAQNQDQDNFVSEMPEPAFLFKDDEAGFQLLPKRTFDPEALVFYIHSSGTTSLPKPVPVCTFAASFSHGADLSGLCSTQTGYTSAFDTSARILPPLCCWSRSLTSVLLVEGTHDFRNKILACQSIPMFHGLGVVSIVMLVGYL
jgi:acyl-CoA synthetase (AMP-forming)/AMP-acid ligase II